MSMEDGLQKRIVDLVGGRELPFDLWHEEVQSIVADIKRQSVSILALVTLVGPYLTHDTDSHRARATGLVAEVASQVQLRRVQDVNHLSQFFTARLSDWPSIGGALGGCLALVLHPALDAGNGRHMLETFSQVVFVRSLPVESRIKALELLEHLLSRYGREILSKPYEPLSGDDLLGTQPHATPSVDLLETAMAALDGERDPRCLLKALRILSSAIRLYEEQPPETLASARLDSMGTIEELFDIVACYFPVDFSPPPSDHHDIITREDVAVAVLDALLSTPLFVPLLLPFLRDTLSSSVKQAKQDALDVLLRVAQVHPNAVKESADVFWGCLRPELMGSYLKMDSWETPSQRGASSSEKSVSNASLSNPQEEGTVKSTRGAGGNAVHAAATECLAAAAPVLWNSVVEDGAVTKDLFSVLQPSLHEGIAYEYADVQSSSTVQRGTRVLTSSAQIVAALARGGEWGAAELTIPAVLHFVSAPCARDASRNADSHQETRPLSGKDSNHPPNARMGSTIRRDLCWYFVSETVSAGLGPPRKPSHLDILRKIYEVALDNLQLRGDPSIVVVGTGSSRASYETEVDTLLDIIATVCDTMMRHEHETHTLMIESENETLTEKALRRRFLSSEEIERGAEIVTSLARMSSCKSQKASATLCALLMHASDRCIVDASVSSLISPPATESSCLPFSSSAVTTLALFCRGSHDREQPFLAPVLRHIVGALGLPLELMPLTDGHRKDHTQARPHRISLERDRGGSRWKELLECCIRLLYTLKSSTKESPLVNQEATTYFCLLSHALYLEAMFSEQKGACQDQCEKTNNDLILECLYYVRTIVSFETYGLPDEALDKAVHREAELSAAGHSREGPFLSDCVVILTAPQSALMRYFSANTEENSSSLSLADFIHMLSRGTLLGHSPTVSEEHSVGKTRERGDGAADAVPKTETTEGSTKGREGPVPRLFEAWHLSLLTLASLVNKVFPRTSTHPVWADLFDTIGLAAFTGRNTIVPALIARALAMAGMEVPPTLISGVLSDSCLLHVVLAPHEWGPPPTALYHQWMEQPSGTPSSLKTLFIPYGISRLLWQQRLYSHLLNCISCGGEGHTSEEGSLDESLKNPKEHQKDEKEREGGVLTSRLLVSLLVAGPPLATLLDAPRLLPLLTERALFSDVLLSRDQSCRNLHDPDSKPPSSRNFIPLFGFSSTEKTICSQFLSFLQKVVEHYFSCDDAEKERRRRSSGSSRIELEKTRDVDRQQHAALQESLVSFIPGLIQCISYPHRSVVRQLALVTLASFAKNLSYSPTIHAWKNEVIRAVCMALDDNKRAVRMAAVMCRQAWEGPGSLGLLQ